VQIPSHEPYEDDFTDSWRRCFQQKRESSMKVINNLESVLSRSEGGQVSSYILNWGSGKEIT
jgi:hypothetical protein